METIEFGCALTTREGTLLDSKPFLVRPVRHPHLSNFCRKLTGISQTMVDTAPGFTEVCQESDSIYAWQACRAYGTYWKPRSVSVRRSIPKIR